MNKTALEDLHFDTVVTAEYKLKMSAAASGSECGDRPVIFAEGGFDDGAAVTSTATEESAVGLTPLDSGLSQAYDDSTARLPWYERITAPISGGIIEQRHVSIPDDGQAVHTLHYLPPEVSIGRLEVYVMQDGRWIKADTAEFGSYLTFDVAGTEADIAAVSVISIWWLWGAYCPCRRPRRGDSAGVRQKTAGRPQRRSEAAARKGGKEAPWQGAA